MAASEKTNLVIVGAGIVGCALAARLARKGLSVFILEKNERIADGVTSRGSGVIHSGLYYPPDSLKTQSCVRGNALLYEYCEDRNVPHSKCGKLILARNPREEDLLEGLHQNALACGAKGLQRLSRSQAHSMEKDLPEGEALFCKESGIVDPVALSESLRLDAEEAGATFSLGTAVQAIEFQDEVFALQTSRGEISTRLVINSAGLYADDVARMVGIDKYEIHPWRGDYFRWKTPKTFHHMIYPVPDPNRVGLGIHLTLDLSGHFRLGPDSTYSETKEPGAEALEKRILFHQAAQKLFGPLDIASLEYDQHGLRPTLREKDSRGFKDFSIAEDLPGFYSFVGIESPGLTAALALAEYFEKEFL